MGRPPSSPVKSPLRFVLSCGATLLSWAAWIILGSTLAALAYVALARDLPVPAFVVRQLESRLADANLTLRFERVLFDPQGRLLLEGVAVHSPRFEEPLLSSRLVYLEGSFWSTLAGHAVPSEIRLEGATLQLPAMISPTGTAEPVLRDLAGTLRHAEGRWRAEQLVFRAGSVAVTVRGEFVPPRRPGAPPVDLASWVDAFIRQGRPIASWLQRTATWDTPVLAVELQSAPGIGHTASLEFSARELPVDLDGAPARLEGVTAAAALRLEATTTRPLRVLAGARRVLGDGWRADAVQATIQAELASGFPPRVSPLEAWVHAATAVLGDEEARTPVVHAQFRAWPRLDLAASTRAGTEPLAVRFSGHLGERSGRLHLAGRGDPRFLNGLLARRAPRFGEAFDFRDPVDFDTRLELAPGWRLARADTAVTAGRLVARDVPLSGASGRFAFDGREFLASDAILTLGDNVARGSYWMDVTTLDYRMLLTGRLRPMAIGGWFRRSWWRELWDDFDFTAAAPVADVDLAGRWPEPRLTRNFIAAEARDPRVRTVPFERVRTRLFVRPQLVDGLHLDASRAGGEETLRGTFARRVDLDRRVVERIDFAMESTVDPGIFRALSRGAWTPLIDDWEFTQWPSLRFDGSWRPDPTGAGTRMTFRGDVAGGLRFHGFPLETLRAEGSVDGWRLQVDQLDFTAARGQGRGVVRLGGPPDDRRLGFDLYVRDAELGAAVRAVQEYEAAQAGQEFRPPDESPFLRRAAAAKLELALSAEGRPGEIATFDGSGNARLTGATLSEIHLFGLLSQVLSGLTLNFSTLKLDTVHGSFQLGDGRVHFPDLKVTGSGAEITGKGDYRFTDNALDFTARFKPYAENRNIFTGILSLPLNPLTSIIELKLTGPLAKPVWSYSFGQSAPTARPPSPAAEAGRAAPPPAVPASPPAGEPPPRG